MSIDVTAQYGDGDFCAADITNPLSSSIEAAKRLGFSFLADNSGLQDVTLLVRGDSRYYPGHVVQVVDSRQGVVWYGKIINVSHTISTDADTPVLDTTLELKKVM